MSLTEYLDIVTENNEPTGESASRAEVHEKGLYHRVVNVLFFRLRDNKVQLLCHQRSNRVEQNARRWDPAIGGHVQSGKTVGEALLDEIREEVGLELASKDFIEGPCLKISDPNEKKFNYFYFYNLESTDGLKVNPREISTIQFMDVEQVADAMQQNPRGWAGFPERLHLMLGPLLKKYA